MRAPARRGWFLGALAGFFSFGFVGAALIGRFVVPLSDSGWRWAPVVTAVPVLMVLWWRRSLPESPRYLLLRGRTAEAELVVADFERRAEASLGTALPPVPPSAAAPELIGATARRARRTHGISSAFGRIGSITAPAIIRFFAAALGFAGVFTMTTAVLLVGVAVVLGFGLSTAGQSLEELSERPGAGRGRVARRAVMVAGTTS